MGMQDGELNPEEIKSGKDRNRSRAEGVTMARQVVGNIGMFYAAYRLSQHGWNVMPTSRNARGVDLLAYDVSAHIFKGIQVKALSRRDNVRLGNTLDKFMGDWWIIVTNAATTVPVCFIMEPREVKQLARRSEKKAATLFIDSSPINTTRTNSARHGTGLGAATLPYRKWALQSYQSLRSCGSVSRT
jgi:hypothetical protein